MSIQHQVSLSESESQLGASGFSRYTAGSQSFTSDSIEVGTSDETLALGDVITPRYVLVRLLSGDDVRVGLDGATYPFRLSLPGSGIGESLLLRLDVEGLQETSTITCDANFGDDLAGTYFDLTDRNGVVRVWYNMPGAAEVSTIECVADVAASLDGKYFVLQDEAGSVGVWFDVDDNGTTAPTGATTCDRQIEVTGVASDATAAQVATAVKNALDADAKFSASVVDDTVTVTDADIGGRTDIAAGDSGFTVAVATYGYSASTPPDDDPERLLPVVIGWNDSASAVAAATAAAINADAEFSATADGAVVTVVDVHTGSRTNIADGDTSFVVATTQGGAASPVVHLKSVGTSQVVVAIAPN